MSFENIKRWLERRGREDKTRDERLGWQCGEAAW